MCRHGTGFIPTCASPAGASIAPGRDLHGVGSVQDPKVLPNPNLRLDTRQKLLKEHWGPWSYGGGPGVGDGSRAVGEQDGQCFGPYLPQVPLQPFFPPVFPSVTHWTLFFLPFFPLLPPTHPPWCCFGNPHQRQCKQNRIQAG